MEFHCDNCGKEFTVPEAECDSYPYEFQTRYDSYTFCSEQCLNQKLDTLGIKALKEVADYTQWLGDNIIDRIMRKDPSSDYNCAKRNGCTLLQPDGNKIYEFWKIAKELKDEKQINLVTEEPEHCDSPVVVIDAAFKWGYLRLWKEEYPDKPVFIDGVLCN